MLISRARRRLTHVFIDRGIFSHALEEQLKREFLSSRPRTRVATGTAPVPERRRTV